MPMLTWTAHWTTKSLKLAILIVLFLVPPRPMCLQAQVAPQYLSYAATGIPQVFPQSGTPSASLKTFDARRLAPSTQAWLASMQGLINRNQPELYLLLSRNRIAPLISEEPGRQSIDSVWLDWLVQEQYLNKPTAIPDIPSLLAEYPLRDVVVVDPELPAALNVATMISAVRGIPLAYPEDVERWNLNPVEDTRGRWQTNVQAYQWAWENLWPELNPRAIAILSPRIHGHLRDYLVSHKIFTFWISHEDFRDDTTPGQELDFFQSILRQMPVNIPVLGYPNHGGSDTGIGEGKGVKLLSDFGKFLVPTDWHTNLTVWSGLAPRQKVYQQTPAEALQWDPETRYITVLVSDGDNMNLWLDFLPTQKYWRSPLRGQIPIAWTMGPGMFQLHGPLVDYYYESSTANDSFGCALSGLGYMYPQHYGSAYGDQQSEILQRYLKLTNAFTDAMDLRWYWGTIVGDRADHRFQQVATELSGLTCILEGYGRQWWRDEPYQVQNVPVFHFLNDAVDVRPTTEQVQRALSRKSVRFGVIFIQNWPFDMEKIQTLCESLGTDIRLVSPQQLASLYQQSLRATSPGKPATTNPQPDRR